MSTRVLIVDDEENLVWSTERQLKRERPSWTIECFTDSEKAWQRMCETPPDVLVTDLRMPKLTGLDLLINARQKWAQLPVVIMTAFRTFEFDTAVQRHSSVTCLEKPFELSDLLRTLDRCSERADSGFSGSLRVPMLPDLVQIQALAKFSGAMRITRDDQQGAIWFSKGEIVHAEWVGNAIGEAAFFELLSWKNGRFSVEADAKPKETTIAAPWMELLMEGCRRMDETSNSPSGDLEFDDVDISNLAEHSESRDAEVAQTQDLTHTKGNTMGNLKQCLDTAMSIDGAIGVALVDWKSGMCLGTAGGGPQLNMEVAAAGNTEVVRAKLKVMGNLNLRDKIEDILISLGSQYHVIRLNAANPNLFFYLAVDRNKSNLAMARHKLAEIEAGLQL